MTDTARPRCPSCRVRFAHPVRLRCDYCDHRRYELGRDFMAAMLVPVAEVLTHPPLYAATLACEYADALLAELHRGQPLEQEPDPVRRPPPPSDALAPKGTRRGLLDFGRKRDDDKPDGAA